MSLSIDPQPRFIRGFFLDKFWTNFSAPEKSGKIFPNFPFWENGKIGKMNFNPEKIFSGIWIIPIIGFTFVPGRAGRKRNRGRHLLRQFGEIGSQNRNVHLLDLSVLGFCVYTPGN